MEEKIVPIVVAVEVMGKERHIEGCRRVGGGASHEELDSLHNGT